MTGKEIQLLSKDGLFQENSINGKLEETHISWVILTDAHAFKLKKPLKLTFLDYSTLELRKKYCHLELELNSRFTDIYIAVLAVRKFQGQWMMGGDKGEVVDYAVQMKRLETDKKMDNLLVEKKVTEKNIRSLAKVVAVFHQNAKKIYEPFQLETARNLFNDLGEVSDFTKSVLGREKEQVILKAMGWSDDFLIKHTGRFHERIAAGMKRDVHGDLHSGNIFLYETPILFDCIEFNDQYRQIDVLYEIAFLCMDLEAFGQKELSDHFLLKYDDCFRVLFKGEDMKIFKYFKCLRANVRAKVHLISAQQTSDPASRANHLAESDKYLLLIKDYMQNMDY